ncbi:hypothetical protein LEP1GSC016_2919 [Leptospira borgpetersenii serovar Hardjo-bovis str. Sponselee]|uniref:Uncharacterized protein n=1 Tax=Leptospira borgpetersenii serovar Hardjo-bovis str. Sponselee TaxID=1303729 RepID=M6C0I1_LEPBO|nr:hypothetical protein LEP1GSC016_2919 [Leptospira borgpetersenii serovar Hardjo-bovis str. Sponselee]
MAPYGSLLQVALQDFGQVLRKDSSNSRMCSFTVENSETLFLSPE